MIGLIGKKIGMTQVFDEKGVITPVTVIQIDENTVVAERSKDKHGYDAVVLGAGDMKERRATKPYKGQFPEGAKPKRILKEFREFDAEYTVGGSLGVELLGGLEYVDVQGVSKGKGYQGVMKRHGFGGGRKTHGSKFHRGLGSTGMAAWPSKVQKGTKMPGRMGADKVIVQNLRVVRVDADKKVILVKGAIPGPRGSSVIVREAKKKY
jgi:large subunit ribosomal protein L3